MKSTAEKLAEHAPTSAQSNQELMARRGEAVARGVGAIHPVFAERAENATVWDVENHRIVGQMKSHCCLSTAILETIGQ